MKTYQAAAADGTRYVVERTRGMVGVCMPWEFMTLQVMDALRGSA